MVKLSPSQREALRFAVHLGGACNYKPGIRSNTGGARWRMLRLMIDAGLIGREYPYLATEAGRLALAQEGEKK